MRYRVRSPLNRDTKKYVAIYEGLLANLRSYEKGLDDLKITYEALIEKQEEKRGNLSN